MASYAMDSNQAELSVAQNATFRIFVVKLYEFCLSIAYIARQHHP